MTVKVTRMTHLPPGGFVTVNQFNQLILNAVFNSLETFSNALNVHGDAILDLAKLAEPEQDPCPHGHLRDDCITCSPF